MKSHCGIGHDCFRSRGCDLEKTPRFLHNFIAHVIEISFLRLVNYFFVRERSLCSRVPVDHAPPAINQALVIKIDESLLDCANVIVIESITFPRPVARTAKTLELFDNDAAMFLLPIQHAAQKFFAAKIVARFLFRSQQKLFDSGLRSDAGVVHAWQPKHFESLHPRAPGENVLDRIVQNVTKRQDAGDVRWRHDNRECRLR